MTEKQLASLILNVLSEHFGEEGVQVLTEQNGSGDNWVSNKVELNYPRGTSDVFSVLVFKDVGAVIFYEENEYASD